MSELRWILLGFGVLLMIGIWWSWRRGSAQARGSALNPEPDPLPAAATATQAPSPAVPHPHTVPIQHEPPVSPFEPLHISKDPPAGDSNALEVPVLSHVVGDVPLVRLENVHVDTGTTHELPVEQPGSGMAMEEGTAESEPVTIPAIEGPAVPEPAAAPATPQAHMGSGRFARREPRPVQRTDVSGRFSRVRSDPPKPVELQKILSVRVVALSEEGWSGEDVAAALVGSDMVYGRYGVFHRLHADGRTVFHVASLVEPGSFDPALMPEQTFPGLSVFAVLPGPLPPLETLEQVLAGARQMAIDLAGAIQDEQGHPLTPHKAGLLREEMRAFQGRLQGASAP